MGANISLLAPNAHTVAIRSYVDVLPGYKFLEVLNNTRFLKTIKAYDTKTGTLVVIKIFVKPPQASVRLQDTTSLLVKEASLLAPFPNLLMWREIIETESAGYLVRQLVKTNLYDRLSLRPFLAPIEKRWLVFQMLKTVELLHDRLHICHGDLKTENFLVTSSNWLTLADFAQNVKPVYLPDDNPSEFVFFFDSSNRRACYVAPERFYNKSSQKSITRDRDNWKLTSSMDLFSLGCVIAELYMDGEPPFTLSDLYKYKKGNSAPNISGVTDPDVQDILKSLLCLDPEKRLSASEILALNRGSYFPEFFYDFFYDFMSELNTSSNFVVSTKDEDSSPSDLILEKIHECFDELIEALGYAYSRTEPHSEDTSFPYLKLDLKGLPANYSIKMTSQKTLSHQNQEALIVLDTVFSLLKTIRRPRNKIRACEIILALSEHIGDEAKLDRCLPYLCSFLDEFIAKVSRDPGVVNQGPSLFQDTLDVSSVVASTSIIAMTNLLGSCSTVNPINSHVFHDFVFPKLKALAFLNGSMVEEINRAKSALSLCLPHLVQISDKFIVFSTRVSPLTEGAQGERSLEEIVINRCEAEVKDITEALLTDPNVNVRIELLANILPLCQFLGVDKTNDIILPHLITYLNDSSFQLRLAFLSSVKDIAEFIGVLAFEQYLLPLLIQTLGDHEPFIILKVLEIFNHLVSERIINPKGQFNALSIYKELLSSTLMLLLQPNEWIRHSVIFLILSIAESLSNADKFCFLYPLIKGYLSYDISIFSWDQLYPCLTRPISRQVLELAFTWLSKSTGKSLFWKQTGVSVFRAKGKSKAISYSKDMGKSIYLAGSSSSRTSATEKNALTETPLSHNDRQWILKLKAIGMEERDLWKIAALRTYLIGVSRSGAYVESGNSTNFELATSSNVPPLNIFCEFNFKSEAMTNREKGITFNLEPGNSSRLKNLTESITGSSALVRGAKATASLQTDESNIFAEFNSPHDEPSSKSHNHQHQELQKGLRKQLHKVYCVSEEKIISATIKHNFEGQNPHILSYLQNIDLTPSFDDFVEFGQTVKSNNENEVHRNRSFHVNGTQVTHINTNQDARSIGAITKIALCPSSEFFVTGSENGALKVWDTTKLENASAKTAVLSLNLKNEVTDITFLSNRFVFAVATSDGQVRLFRVQVMRGKNRKILKYSKLSMIRIFKLDEGFARCVNFTEMNSKELMVVVTSTSRLVAFEVFKTKKVFDLLNPAECGAPTTSMISNSSTWLLLGTSEGVLCLWDLRFEILLQKWKVSSDQLGDGACGIQDLIPISYASRQKSKEHQEYFAMIGGTDGQDVTVWNIPTFECKEIFSSKQDIPKIKKYTLQKVDVSKTTTFENIMEQFTLDFDQSSSKCNTSMAYNFKSGTSFDETILTSTCDSRLTLWNVGDISQSISLHDVKSKFNRTVMGSSVSMSYEIPSTAKSDAILTQHENHDAVTSLVMVTYPFPMIVVGERSGYIRVYK